MSDGQKQTHGNEKSHQKAPPDVVMGGTGTEPPKDAKTGEPVQPPNAHRVSVSAEEFEAMKREEARYRRSKGDFAAAAEVEGKKYEPTAGERVIHMASKAKSVFIDLAILAVPGAIVIWCGNQVLRFISPKLREKLPAWGINYEPVEEKKKLR